MAHRLIMTAIIAATVGSASASDPQLAGSIMSSGQGTPWHDVSMVCDGNPSSYFQARTYGGEYSRTWVGYDLGSPHVITSVNIAAAVGFEDRLELALIEGANSGDFSDAMPIAMIRQRMNGGVINEVNVNCSRGFRYVRVMAPANKACTVAELSFNGYSGEGDDSQLFQITNLPTVVINTEGMAQIMHKDHKVPGMVYIISEDGRNVQTEVNTEIKGRGNGSWTFPKKPYRLKFEKKNSVLDSPGKAKKWTLINNYGDKALMRNKLAFDISRAMEMAYTPYCRFVDVVMNGQYEGSYQLCDQIDVRKERVNITEMTPEDTFGEALTGGYFVEIDAYASEEMSWFKSIYGQPVTIKSPDDDEITREQSLYIENHFNLMEESIMSTSSDDSDGGYTRYLDLDAFLKFVMINELAGNPDVLWSVYMSKERGDDRFVTGPVWDFDLAFENDVRVYPMATMTDYIFNYNVQMASYQTRSMASRIVQYDDNAKNRMTSLWTRARLLNELSYENMCDSIDRYAAELDESQELTFRRWPILNQRVHQNPMVLGSYAAEVEHIKDFLRERFDILDERFGIDYTVDVSAPSAESIVKETEGYYDLLGRRIAAEPTSGFYIERYSDGTAVKRFK